jgi:hypothetical protein
VSTKTGSAAIVAHVLASERDAPVPRDVMNRQVGDAGRLPRDRQLRYGDCSYMLAGRNVRGRDAANCVVGTDLESHSLTSPQKHPGWILCDRRTNIADAKPRPWPVEHAIVGARFAP